MRRKYPFSFSDVSQNAGVSVATVSRVINNQENVRTEQIEKVTNAIAKMGYDPHDYILKEQPTGKIILFLLPFDFNSFFNEIIKGAKASAVQHGFTMIILQEYINSNTIKAFENLIKTMKISGVICLNHISGSYMHSLCELVPVVQCCDYDSESKEVSSVSLDDYKMSIYAVEHLISNGCKKIAFMSGSLKYKDNNVRQQGYIKALSSAGIMPMDRWIINLPEINYNMAFSSATQILSQNYRPDGFLAISDLYACAIVNAARQLHISVPRDLKVVGYDNVDYATISYPKITTVNTPKYQMGYTASELLIDKIQNPKSTVQHITLQSELIVRDSTISGMSSTSS